MADRFLSNLTNILGILRAEIASVRNQKLQPGPKGDKGDKGDPGARGEIGEAGYKGDRGEQGEKGDRGDEGKQGLKGPKGDRGEKGDKGDPGPQGKQGPQGSRGPAGGSKAGGAILPPPGTTGQVLALINRDTLGWVDQSAGAGTVTGPASSVDGEIVLFDGITGEVVKSATQTGLLKATAGVLQVAVADTDYLTPGTATATYQPLDGDLTAIAALSTTAYGRGLLTLASAAALAGEVDPFFLTPAEGNAAYQPLDTDLTEIAALAPTDDDILQQKAGVWTNRTMAQVAVDLQDETQTFTNKTFDADGAGNSLTNIEDANIKAAAAIDAAKIANGSVSNAEFQFLDGVTSGIQTQLNTKLANVEEDLTPTLGGNLAGNAKEITGLSKLSITGLATGALSVVSGIASFEGIVFQQNTDDAGQGPLFSFIRNSASPAAADLIGGFYFWGKDSAANTDPYVLVRGRIDDPTSGSEDGSFTVIPMIAGVQTVVLQVGDGVRIGAPAGGYKGAGTLNTLSTIYVNNVPVLTETTGQPLDADLTTIAGLTATTDNFIQSKSSAWASRTPTQVTADLIAMVGDSGAGGTKGLVPAPAAGDATKFLRGDATWQTPSGGTSKLYKRLEADATGATGTAAQPWFPTAGAVTVAAGTTYLFEGILHVTSAGGANTTFSMLLAGTASIHEYSINIIDGVLTDEAAIIDSADGLGATFFTSVSNAVDDYRYHIQGSVRINAGGTLIPQFKFNTTPGAVTVLVKDGTYFALEALGSNPQGTWA